jgi:hypothetical protein
MDYLEINIDNPDEDSVFPREDIEILSNRGWGSIFLHFIDTFQTDDETLILISLRSLGKYWNRNGLVVSGSELVLTEDYETSICQVVLSQSKLESLLKNIENWLLEPFEFVVDISGDPGTTVTLSVSWQQEYIGNRDRPVIKLSYDSHQARNEWSFVTDYTCLNIFREGLRSWIITL